MATSASTWLMTEAQSIGRGYYQRDIVTDVPYGVVDGTQRRDVSEVLDVLALTDTPFINKIGWGPESGGTKIEWISEDLGPGKIKVLSAMTSDTISFVANSIDGLDASDSLYQVKQGSVLYYYCSATGNNVLAVVTSTPAAGGTGVSITLSILTTGHGAALMSVWASVNIGKIFYTVGAFANEGSIPGKPMPRQRVICSNIFTILRQDVQITGSMKATDMYAIGREDKHQVLMRLKEMQRDRERTALYSAKIAKTTTTAGLMDGVLGFLASQSGTHIDITTNTLTNTALNTAVSFLWENGARNLSIFGHINQTSKITRWDMNRIRMRPNETRGGGYITSYMTESGIECDIIPMANVPTNLMFVLDTARIKLRAKKGRKAVMDILGKMGDFDDWEILSEFTMEMKGYNLKQHGMFTRLV
jgi:hypothetical protein